MITAEISLFAFYAARVILVLLILLSVSSVAFFIERWLYYRHNFLANDAIVMKIDEVDSLGEISAVLAEYKSSESKIIQQGLRSNPESAESFSLKVRAHYRHEKVKWERWTVFLGSVGANAPFIGLLGTVLGILKSFADLGAAASTGPKVVMAGISEALILTAVGLAVAIPAVLFFNICKSKIKAAGVRVESITDIISSKALFK